MRWMMALAMLCGTVAAAETLQIEGNDAQKALLPAYVIECQQVAKEKLHAQAEAFGIEVNMASLRVTGASNRVIAKYLWWTVDVVGNADRPTLSKLTQKPLGGRCF